MPKKKSNARVSRPTQSTHLDSYDRMSFHMEDLPTKNRLSFKNDAQREACRTIKYNTVTFLGGPAGTAKCISGDSLVLTESGLQRIDALVTVDSPDSYAETSFRVASPHGGMALVTHLYNGGLKHTRKIRNNFGMSIEASTEHPLLTINSMGCMEWRKSSDLAAGDYIAVARGNNVFGDLSEVDGFKIDEDFGYYAGILTGEGGLTLRDRISLTSVDDYTINEFYRISHKYDMSVHKKDIAYSVYSRSFSNKLSSLGVERVKSPDRSVPWTILGARREVILSFLRGIFDTDGYVTRITGEVGIKLSSEVLVDQIQLLLLNLGIVSTKITEKPKKVGAFKLKVTGRDCDLFFEATGFGLKRGQTLIGQTIRNTGKDVVPNIGAYILRARSRQRTPGEILKKLLDYIASRYVPSYGKLGELVEALNYEYPERENLCHILDTNFLWTKIVSVENSENYVYDLAVDETHSFVANGFVNHNTFLAVGMMMDALRNGDVEKGVISRPSVEAGATQGFLPGGFKEKMDPFMRPIYDCMEYFVGREATRYMVEEGIVEILPFQVMRGRTLSDAFVVLDETQNATDKQLRLALTRIGFGSKMVVTFDKDQIDLDTKNDPSLVSCIEDIMMFRKTSTEVEEIKRREHIGYFEFSMKDIVRAPIVLDILGIYREKEAD